MRWVCQSGKKLLIFHPPASQPYLLPAKHQMLLLWRLQTRNTAAHLHFQFRHTRTLIHVTPTHLKHHKHVNSASLTPHQDGHHIDQLHHKRNTCNGVVSETHIADEDDINASITPSLGKENEVNTEIITTENT